MVNKTLMQKLSREGVAGQTRVFAKADKSIFLSPILTAQSVRARPAIQPIERVKLAQRMKTTYEVKAPFKIVSESLHSPFRCKYGSKSPPSWAKRAEMDPKKANWLPFG